MNVGPIYSVLLPHTLLSGVSCSRLYTLVDLRAQVVRAPNPAGRCAQTSGVGPDKSATAGLPRGSGEATCGTPRPSLFHVLISLPSLLRCRAARILPPY